MKKCLITLMAIFAVVAVQAASIHTAAADASPAMRVYAGADTVSVTIATGGASASNYVIINGFTNTVDGSGNTDTVAELAAAIAACTNSAGTASLVVDTDCVVATTESTDGELLDGTYTKGSDNWIVVPWDTSDVVHYSVYIPDGNAGGIRSNQATLGSIYGSPTGTGAVTLSVYLDGTLSWQKLMPEIYAYSNNTAAVELPVSVGIPIGGKSVLIRAVRATTATTGMIGATVE